MIPKWLYRRWLLFSEPIIVIKHHYGYINVWGLVYTSARERAEVGCGVDGE